MGVLTDKSDVSKITKTRGHGNDNGYDAAIVDVQDFFDNVLVGYNKGADDELAADVNVARSIVPAGTGAAPRHCASSARASGPGWCLCPGRPAPGPRRRPRCGIAGIRVRPMRRTPAAHH